MLNKPNLKLPYVKPRLRTIELNADEVLAEGCKTAEPAGGVGGQCAVGNQCFNMIGS